MLHERIRDENEVAGNPTSERDRNRSAEVSARAQSFLTPDQRADECALQEEREHSFHCERLANHAAGILRKVSPICSELKFHRNPRDDTDREIESEDLRPKPNSLVVFLVTSSERAPFPVNQKPREPHGELRKQIVINDREPELQPVPKARIVKDRVHCRSLGRSACGLFLCCPVFRLCA